MYFSKNRHNLKNLINRYNFCLFREISGLNLWNEEISSEIKHKIESHWKDRLKTDNFNENNDKKEKYYVLSMFPYPSGFLHMGHVRVYTISDAIARYQRMNGKNVIHPIGWDAFGLPAENAAIERRIPPNKWTKNNIKHMKEQLKQLGCSFEWNREIATCDKDYYKWTQELFLKLYDAGLAYQKEALVNWDPIDKTVLADEQVDENGISWRSGAVVEKKLLKQWFIKTTKFAKQLLDGLDDNVLLDWRDIIKLQKHWIGECNGVNFDFKLNKSDDFITLWSDFPEYIENIKFVAISEGHILAKKSKIKFEGNTKKLEATLKNPFNNENIPIYLTNEVDFLPQTNSYIGIPTIKESDAIFATKHNIPFENVPKLSNSDDIIKKRQQICERATKLNVGGYFTSAKLRDWLISRQRYWGAPIPIIHCKNCGTLPVPHENLPVELPELTEMSEKGFSQLRKIKKWLNTQCPKCKGEAERETDTMDTFVDSSWYYLRYLDPDNNNEMFDTKKVEKIMPVDLYIGGKEHAVLHLYYARFVSHFLHSINLLKDREPFKRLLVQGMVMGRTFRLKNTGEYLPENKVEIINLKKNQAVSKDTKQPVTISWEKMSKSKYNGVDPDEMFREYGTDTTRLLILADVAPTSHRNWNSNTFPGIINWQKRLWLTIRDFLKYRNNLPKMIEDDTFKKHDDYMFDSRNFYIKGVSFNYLISQQLSVAVSKQQGLTNSLRKVPPNIIAHSLQFERAVAAQIILLAPMAPHFSSELWSGFISAPNRLNSTEIFWEKSVHEQKWPETDMDYKLDLVCEVNGFENCVVKFTRKELERLSKEEAVEVALKQSEIQSTLSRRNILDVKYIPHSGFDSVINILTDQPPPRVKQKQSVEN